MSVVGASLQPEQKLKATEANLTLPETQICLIVPWLWPHVSFLKSDGYTKLSKKTMLDVPGKSKPAQNINSAIHN